MILAFMKARPCGVAPVRLLCRGAIAFAVAWWCAAACNGAPWARGAAYASEAPSPAPFAIVDQAGISWADPQADITVFDQARLHPGSSGVYRFTVENRTAESAAFAFDAKAAAVSPNFSEPVPVGLSFRLGGADAAGAESDGGTAGSLATVVVPAEGSIALSLEWEWPYEGGFQADRIDSMIGSDGQARLRLMLSAKAEGSPGDGSGEPGSQPDGGSNEHPADPGKGPGVGGGEAGRNGQQYGKDLAAGSLVKTGDPSLAALAVAGASVFASLAVYARRRSNGGCGPSHASAANYRTRRGNRG